jgi:outer membrane protein assembly factor BamD (BamD/ComL family)
MRDGAAELFSVANQARRASRFAEAKRLYHRLQEQFPGSSEAQLSLLTLASLQLDTGNAGAALRMFDRYLRRAGGPLEAEALYGRARALRRLNQGNAEARAWRGLLAKYPGSRYAHEAQERLKALSVD